jgi:hypothetical protein
MLRSLRHRALRAALSLAALATFLGASAADARGLDPCPHHDALSLARHGAAAGAEPAHDAPAMRDHDSARMDHAAHVEHMGGAAHADPSTHAHGAAPTDGGPQNAHEHGPCNCVGSCDTGGSPPLVTRVPDVVVTVAPVEAIVPPAVAHQTLSGRDDGWTPYLPQAPPLPL